MMCSEQPVLIQRLCVCKCLTIIRKIFKTWVSFDYKNMILDHIKGYWSVLGEFCTNILHLSRRCNSQTRLDGKVAVITGGNTGLGKETAYQLSLRGAKIIIASRDVTKGETAINDIKAKNPKADISVVKLDLSSLTSVRQFAKTVAQKESKLDLLINNAGVRIGPEAKTEDGFEMQFGVHHLGHFLLTLSLLPLLKNSSNARVISVSTKGYMMGKINFENINLRNGAYSPLKAHCQSKLAMILFIRELAKRLGPNSNVKAYSLHPGSFENEDTHKIWYQRMLRAINLLLSTEMGAQTTLYCALEESIENESGSYYDDCKRVDKPLAKATDDETAEKLWELSCDLVQLEEHLKLKPNVKDESGLTQNKNNSRNSKVTPVNEVEK